MAPVEYDAIVVGGGFGGVYTTYQLRELGYNVHSFEKGSFIGGIWYWNKYPGARVDSDVPVYQLWLEQIYKDWDFKERFPGWKELNEYFAHVDKKIQISKNYSFNTFVSACHFDEKSGKWTVTTNGEDAGTFIAKHLVVCTGFAAKKYIPDFKGLDKYKGIMHHTCEWPGDDVDFKNKKVAVVGTGASGVQVIQEVGPIVEDLTVYQRTPNIAIPMRQRAVTHEEQEARRADYDKVFAKTLTDGYTAGFEFGFDPRSALEVTDEEREAHLEKCWATGGFHFWVATFQDVWTNLEADKYQYEFWRRKTLERLTRPELYEKLAPAVALNPFCSKRPCLEQTYYEVYNQPNVDIVDLRQEPILEFTEKGIKTANGEKEFDIIVLATGFDAVTGGLTQMDIRGIHGETLADKWETGGLRTYLGVAVNDFPNMYFMYGPQGPTAFSNGPTCAQIQSNWIVKLIQYTDKHNLKYVQPSEAAEEEWAQNVLDVSNQTLVGLAKTSWYNGTNIPGKKITGPLNYLGGIPRYYREINAEEDKDYESFIKVAA
ncbi:uncharacterized protein SAPINGB_P006448 [Magnusiomyces paraingens]|uniref:FAD/NAD(P)-binding domain-containing protein n=1 Tax=Magnusiomyces paraingens TaxID=2606893 RepID=A0A5E8C643_9ASCO|nr:uncharacterized protein SAPINGB_P006447 [Saprochaete ingens]XP_031857050.1 uncharacterized protein SAPINGB_P006448 [Saprochaete ingens]VVT58913.1 unnamed protein product [Saprochaete ingens]VVT58915.1 unnamed protein product [Saprochaete ingens]